MSYLNNPYTLKVDKLENSHEFSYLATYFNKEKCYTLFPKGTIQYIKFWNDCLDKCLNGFTNSKGISITGQHFFYLNFVQISSKNVKTGKKTKLFPRFVDIDWEYFWYIDYARKTQKSLVTVKGRRQGYSYKAAAVATHEFILIRESSSIIGTFFSSFGEETMGFVLDNCNFINVNTEFSKARNPDTKDYIMARFQKTVGGVKSWKGYHSKVRQITYKDNEFSGVGKSATWLILDEAGVFPNIIQAYGMSEPLIKDGADYTGSCLMFGSAGNMEAGSQYFRDIFVNPEKYNMLEFQDPINPERKIGFFSSAAKGRWGLCRNKNSIWYKQPMVDDEGNSNIEAATDDINYEREVKKKGGDNKALHDFTTQYPLTYNEAFLTTHKSPFPLHYIQERLGELETSPHITNAHWKTDLVQTEDGIKFQMSKKEPVTQFPIRDKTQVDLEGCIEIYEQPYDEKPALGIYLAGIDPYDDDQADNSDSLGSCIIMNSLTKRIVAQYTARPQTAKEYYENVRKLLIYYNCIANYENAKKGLFGYFEQKNCLFLLCDTPKILSDQQVIKTVYETGNNRKGSPATKGVNMWGRELIKTWLYEPAFDKPDGLTNTHVIPSTTVLKELELWNPDGNFDRVSALIMLMILVEDRYKIPASKEKQEEERDDFFSRHYKEDISYNAEDLKNIYGINIQEN